MRITSGILRSRIIKEPKHIRPTQDKVREGLFDIIRARIADSYFLELFSGSGAVGIEALSNGAKEVVLVESDARCYKIIENNLLSLGLVPGKNPLSNISVLKLDAFKAIDIFCKNNKKFDIIYLDPPYYKDLAKKALQKLFACDILAPHGLIITEHSKKDIIDSIIGNLTCFKQKRYGDKLLSFYSNAPQ
jgi:16S rRNA (guanine(966)-N(2))-methyltransferase RsmD